MPYLMAIGTTKKSSDKWIKEYSNKIREEEIGGQQYSASRTVMFV